MEIRVRKRWKRNEMYLAGVTTLNTHSIHNLAMGDSKIQYLMYCSESQNSNFNQRAKFVKELFHSPISSFYRSYHHTGLKSTVVYTQCI